MVILLLCIQPIIMFRFWREEKERIWIVSLILLFSLPPLMFLVWYADAIEISRHAQQIDLQLRIGLVLTFIMTLDLFSTVITRKLASLANYALLLQSPLNEKPFPSS